MEKLNGVAVEIKMIKSENEMLKGLQGKNSLEISMKVREIGGEKLKFMLHWVGVESGNVKKSY